MDHFKLVNDNYGDDIGDRVVQHSGEYFDLSMRVGDGIYKIDGEEFIVLLTTIDHQNAQKVLTDININVSSSTTDQFKFPTSFGGGVVVIDLSQSDYHLDNYLKQANRLLYQAKMMGRNRIKIVLYN